MDNVGVLHASRSSSTSFGLAWMNARLGGKLVDACVAQSVRAVVLCSLHYLP